MFVIFSPREHLKGSFKSATQFTATIRLRIGKMTDWTDMRTELGMGRILIGIILLPFSRAHLLKLWVM